MKLIPTILFLLTLTIQTRGQTNCRYPFEQSADSLVKFVIADIYGLHSDIQLNAKIHSKEFNKYFYNPDSEINHDSIFQICIDDLREKLGTELLCNNVDLYINSFYNSENGRNFAFSVGFTYPILKREEPVRIGTFTSNYERINIEYKYSVNSERKVSIVFPKNIPECNGLTNCNIYVTREKALESLKHWGLMKENDNVKLSVNGLNWEVILTSDDWSFRHLKINFQTGKFYDFKESHRID
jgi:hypothetical protein